MANDEAISVMRRAAESRRLYYNLILATAEAAMKTDLENFEVPHRRPSFVDREVSLQ